MNQQQLQKEYNLLLEVIADLEKRLAEEEERFLIYGKRSVPAEDWRTWNTAALVQYKADLVSISKELRKFEEPEEALKALLKGVSLLTLIKLWWKA
jgi:hypothetical protein